MHLIGWISLYAAEFFLGIGIGTIVCELLGV